MAVKKFAKILLIVLAALVVVVAAGFMLFYFHASEIRFDYCDANVQVVTENHEYDEWLWDNGYRMIYPFFGNSTSINEGSVKSYVFGIGKENEPVYDAVNAPVAEYATQLVDEYENRVKTSYKVTNADGKLTIVLSVIAYPESIDEEAVEINKEFVFDISNASLDNLPTLL